MITAHTGSDGYVDNSLEFIQACLDSSVSAMEIDVQLADDGTLYLAHDMLTNYHAAVSLADCFTLLGQRPDLIVNIDCKSRAVGTAVLAYARQQELANPLVFSGSILLEDFAVADRDKLFYNLENHFSLEQLEAQSYFEALGDLSRAGVTVVQVYYELATPALIKALKVKGIGLSVWTVNDLTQIDHYLDMGCVNVTSRIALTYLKAKKEGR